MGFFSTTMSFTRYRVSEPPPDNFWNWALERVEGHRFREEIDPTREIVVGWASPRNPFQEGLTLVDIAYGHHMLLSLRVDERKVPAAVLKKHCLLEEERMMKEKDLRHISRKMKTEIRDRVRLKLLAKAFPVPRLVDLCWNTQDGVVSFFSCQERPRAMVEDLFAKTFGTRLEAVIPYTLALGELQGSPLAAALEGARPEVLT